MSDVQQTPSASPNPAPVEVQQAAVPVAAAPEPQQQQAPATEQSIADTIAQSQQQSKEVAPDWPDDWREKYANGDDKALKRLQRYGSPKAALDALFNAQNKISSGQLKSAWNPEASPEEKAEWRSQNGIPDEPTGYDLTLKNGVIVGEQDKPLVDAFLQRAHESNMHPEQVKEALSFYFETQEQALHDQGVMDQKTREICEDQLRAEYGPEYRRNMQAVNELLAAVPGGVQDQLLGGRLADGTPIGNSPEVVRWLVGLARELNPVGTLVPGSGTNGVQAAEGELSEMRKLMGNPKSDYWKGPNSQKLQARYRELTSALQRGR